MKLSFFAVPEITPACTMHVAPDTGGAGSVAAGPGGNESKRGAASDRCERLRGHRCDPARWQDRSADGSGLRADLIWAAIQSAKCAEGAVLCGDGNLRRLPKAAAGPASQRRMRGRSIWTPLTSCPAVIEVRARGCSGEGHPFECQDRPPVAQRRIIGSRTPASALKDRCGSWCLCGGDAQHVPTSKL